MDHQDFQLHTRLSQDTLFVTNLGLSEVLLMNDKRFPWIILVPRKKDILELHELISSDQNILWGEITHLSKILQAIYKPDKLNIASIGNSVPQLHIHIVARFKTDMAWPAPVWGFEKPLPYSSDKAKTLIEQLHQKLLQHKLILPSN